MQLSHLHNECVELVKVIGQFRIRTEERPLHLISHLLDLIPYKQVHRDKVKLPKRSHKDEYDDQATLKGRKFVPAKY